MDKNFIVQAVRGMNDVLPAQIAGWQQLERVTRELFAAYGFEEMRVPLVEHTALFKRAIGEYTDIVEKEMYTFTDSGGDSLTLRPEATAGVVRAAISNGLLRGARRVVQHDWRMQMPALLQESSDALHAFGQGLEFSPAHQAGLLFKSAVAAREFGWRPRKSLMNLPASTSFSRSMPVSIPMPWSM